MRAAAVLLAGFVIVAASAPALAQEEGEGGLFIALPLDVEITSPANGTALNYANITAVIEGDGESAASFNDDFANGSRVRIDLTPGGLKANATSPSAQTRYTSPVFEFPIDSPGLEWVSPIIFETSNSSANLTLLLSLDVRFGDRSPSHNWSGWVPATIDGEYGDPLGPGNVSMREWPAIQYEFNYLDPMNASNPTIADVHIWFLAHVAAVEARVAGDPTWTLLGSADGRYNFSLTLQPGPTTIEARVTDALGMQKSTWAIFTLDTIRPNITSATPSGTDVPPDEVAEITFSEPVDPLSAAAWINISADFPVDHVWSADGTRLILSAQESGGTRGPVTVTVGPHVRDLAGNEFGTQEVYIYEMGKPADAPPGDTTYLMIALGALVGLAAITVLYFSGRAKRNKEAYADAVRRELDARGKEPPGED